jgi:hypothetical protein
MATFEDAGLGEFFLEEARRKSILFGWLCSAAPIEGRFRLSLADAENSNIPRMDCELATAYQGLKTTKHRGTNAMR